MLRVPCGGAVFSHASIIGWQNRTGNTGNRPGCQKFTRSPAVDVVKNLPFVIEHLFNCPHHFLIHLDPPADRQWRILAHITTLSMFCLASINNSTFEFLLAVPKWRWHDLLASRQVTHNWEWRRRQMKTTGEDEFLWLTPNLKTHSGQRCLIATLVIRQTRLNDQLFAC